MPTGVEIDLRQPSMLHGKRGFERVVWAFNNVLNQSVAWLFYDLEPRASGIAEGLCFRSSASLVSDGGPAAMPIKKHHPQVIDCDPVRNSHQNILTPAFHATTLTRTDLEGDLQDDCGSLSEWIAMVSLDSPRLSAGDAVDPYLSRYTVPDVDRAKPSNLVSLKWHGFIPSKWVMQLFFVLL